MAQIPDELPAFIPATGEEWRKWLNQDKGSAPEAQRKVMGAVPRLLDFSIGLHSEAQRIEQERDYWKGEAGRLFSLLLRRQKGGFAIRIPFTKYRIVLMRDEVQPDIPLLPQEGEKVLLEKLGFKGDHWIEGKRWEGP